MLSYIMVPMLPWIYPWDPSLVKNYHNGVCIQLGWKSSPIKAMCNLVNTSFLDEAWNIHLVHLYFPNLIIHGYIPMVLIWNERYPISIHIPLKYERWIFKGLCGALRPYSWIKSFKYVYMTLCHLFSFLTMVKM